MKSLLGNVRVAAASLVLLSFSGGMAHAAQGNDFDYPELLVTPRASERLTTEAANESSNRWTNLLPIQVSALSTLVAGVAQLGSPDPVKDPTGKTGVTGLAVGGAWLATTLALEVFYQPYSSAAREISAYPLKTPRQQLMRERYAEEVIHAQARLASRLKWLSVLTQLGTNVYLLSQAMSGSFSQVVDGVAAGLAVAPLIFGSHWQDVANEQDSYKKRIYAPLASATIFREPGTGNIAPGAVLMMSF
ncbi:hypothetical protein WDW37_19710 [Bdellovibrionota bacterium FG-1]